MWDELGIAPCDDPKAIRRAYAARLKKLDPDRDPQAFARLRNAFEWALSGARGDDRDDAPRSSAESTLPASTDRDADAAADDLRTAVRFEAEPDRGGPVAEQSSAPPADNAHKPALQPSTPTPDHDDIRDRALLIALDAALRRRDAPAATALYYRAAASGALSLESAPDAIERLLAVAVDDVTFGAAAFRHLTRTVGLDASRVRALVDTELRRRVLARLRAEDWYEDLLATAEQRKGRVARHRAKIARLLLGRIGRYSNRDVDKTALRSWLAQYKTHAAWLEDRINPAWAKKLEGRLRRREIFWLAFYVLFIGSMLIQSVLLFAASFVEGDVQFWALMIGVPLVAFFFWIFMLLVKELLKLLIPGWTGFARIAPLTRARALWAGRGRAIRNRSKAKKPGDAG